MKKIEEQFRLIDLVFPLFGGDVPNPAEKQFNPNRLVGTCFYLGASCYVTAGHVLRLLEDYPYKMFCCIDQTKGDSSYFVQIEEFEIFDELDIGIFTIKQRFNHIAPLHSIKKHLMLSDIYTAGYPFGFNKESNSVKIRALKGYIVSDFLFEKNEIKGNCFELSFSCPRGISGAPLLSRTFDAHNVIGIVIGNGSSEIEIYSERIESTNYNERKTETTKFGIAISIIQVLKLNSKLLGTTIHEHLLSNNLINLS